MSIHGPLGATPQSGAIELRSPSLRSRTRVAGARLGLLGLAGLLITGLVVSISAAQTDTLLPESVRPLPSWLAGPFGTVGPTLHWPALVAVLVLMLASYLLVAQHADRLSARTVITGIAALHALVLLAPPLFSTDVFSYEAYGRMGALYGADPFLHGPHAIALDQVYPFIGAKWVNTPTVYGPVFTLMSYALAPLSIAAAALAYKAIAAIASLATIALVWNAARLRGLDPVKAVALVGLNPLIVVYGVGGGHNDLLMMAVLMAGVCAMLQHRERAAGALTIAAVGIKLTGGLLLPFALAAEGRGRDLGRRRAVLVGAGVAAAVLVAVGLAFFGTGQLQLLGTLRKGQSLGDWHSIPGFIATRFGLSPIGPVAGMVLAIVFLTALTWLVRRVWRGEMDFIDGAAWATAAMLVTAGSMLPWYVAWLIPLAALASDRRLWRSALWLTGLVQAIQLLGYIPHGSRLIGL